MKVREKREGVGLASCVLQMDDHLHQIFRGVACEK